MLEDEKAEKIPSFLKPLLERFIEQNILSEDDFPNSLIINEYNEGQGIMPHVDSTTIFGKVIMSLSLLSPCVMEFSKDSDFKVLLNQRSLLVMTDEARNEWKHSISKNLIDIYESNEIKRSRRVSLTFRKVLAK